MTPLEQALTKEKNLLEHKVAELNRALKPDRLCPLEWKLTPTEDIFVAALLRHKIVTQGMYQVLLHDMISPASVKVFVCRIRKKVSFPIKAKYLGGYMIPPPHRDRVLAKLP